MKHKEETVKKILTVDDDADFRWVISNVLTDAGYKVSTAGNGKHALASLKKDIPNLILLDYRMPGIHGLALVEEIKKEYPSLPVIIITAYAEIDIAVKAIKMGVYDYVTKPLNNQELLFTIERALEKQQLTEEIDNLRELLAGRTNLFELMGKSDTIKAVVSLVEKIAPTNFNVLIEGESGTGKEILARAIHSMSNVKNGPFISIDCGAIPETLIESELFGYARGAFTGAYQDKPGQFELAQGGTLFLDEVGNLSYPAQHKLLRTIEERRVLRLGAKKTRPFHVRIVAASNRILDEEITVDRFRRDLYYRLNEFSLKVPPLRERKEDIPYLVNKFIGEMEHELGRKCAGLTKEALGVLYSYSWPGNVRELKNIIRRVSIVSDENRQITVEDMMASGIPVYNLPGELANSHNHIIAEGKSLHETVRFSARIIEKSMIEKTLRETKGNKSKAARKLGIDYKTILRKIRSYGID